MSKAGKLRVPEYLGHILEAIRRIHLYVEDMTEVQFLEDAKTQDAVIRNFEIIGYEEVQAKALKRALSEQLGDSMQAAKLTKVDMAQKMETSRSQLDRVLDPKNMSIQLDTLIKAARAVGKVVEIKIKRRQSLLTPD